MHILIAEDDPVHARLVEAAVRPLGARVRCVSDGQAALESVRKERFDVVVADWMMPRLDGIQLAKQLRREIRPSPLVVVVTSLDHPDARAHALTSGADAFLAKPVVAKDLRDTIAETIRRRDGAVPPKACSECVELRPVATPARGFIRPAAPFAGVALVGSTGGPVALAR